MSPEETRLAGLSNHDLIEELAEHEPSGELWVEIGLRLGVEGLHGIRSGAVPEQRTGEQAARLRRFAELWQGQPEAGDDEALRAAADQLYAERKGKR